jgi:hypothetical protein
MKKILLVAVLLACGIVAHGQTCVPGNGLTCTPNLNLYLPPLNYYNWNIALNANFNLLDTASANWVKLNALNTYTVNQTMPGLVITGCASGTYVKADGTGCGTPSGYTPPTCTANQIAYYGSGGSVQACLTVGTGLGITSGALNATGGITGINQLTGDGTAGPGTGSQAFTLTTVNSGSGTCGDATHVCQVTTNGKGLVTTQTQVAISTAGFTSGNNSNGYWVKDPIGHIHEWGTVTCGSSQPCTANFPLAFTTVGSIIVTIANYFPGGDSGYLTIDSTSGPITISGFGAHQNNTTSQVMLWAADGY